MSKTSRYDTIDKLLKAYEPEVIKTTVWNEYTDNDMENARTKAENQVYNTEYPEYLDKNGGAHREARKAGDQIVKDMEWGYDSGRTIDTVYERMTVPPPSVEDLRYLYTRNQNNPDELKKLSELVVKQQSLNKDRVSEYQFPSVESILDTQKLGQLNPGQQEIQKKIENSLIKTYLARKYVDNENSPANIYIQGNGSIMSIEDAVAGRLENNPAQEKNYDNVMPINELNKRIEFFSELRYNLEQIPFSSSQKDSFKQLSVDMDVKLRSYGRQVVDQEAKINLEMKNGFSADSKLPDSIKRELAIKKLFPETTSTLNNVNQNLDKYLGRNRRDQNLEKQIGLEIAEYAEKIGAKEEFKQFDQYKVDQYKVASEYTKEELSQLHKEQLQKKFGVNNSKINANAIRGINKTPKLNQRGVITKIKLGSIKEEIKDHEHLLGFTKKPREALQNLKEIDEHLNNPNDPKSLDKAAKLMREVISSGKSSKDKASIAEYLKEVLEKNSKEPTQTRKFLHGKDLNTSNRKGTFAGYLEEDKKEYAARKSALVSSLEEAANKYGSRENVKSKNVQKYGEIIGSIAYKLSKHFGEAAVKKASAKAPEQAQQTKIVETNKKPFKLQANKHKQNGSRSPF